MKIILDNIKQVDTKLIRPYVYKSLSRNSVPGSYYYSSHFKLRGLADHIVNALPYKPGILYIDNTWSSVYDEVIKGNTEMLKEYFYTHIIKLNGTFDTQSPNYILHYKDNGEGYIECIKQVNFNDLVLSSIETDTGKINYYLSYHNGRESLLKLTRMYRGGKHQGEGKEYRKYKTFTEINKSIRCFNTFCAVTRHNKKGHPVSVHFNYKAANSCMGFYIKNISKLFTII